MGKENIRAKDRSYSILCCPLTKVLQEVLIAIKNDFVVADESRFHIFVCLAVFLQNLFRCTWITPFVDSGSEISNELGCSLNPRKPHLFLLILYLELNFTKSRMLLIFKLALAEVKFVTGMGSAIKAGLHVPFKILLSVYFIQAYSSIL